MSIHTESLTRLAIIAGGLLTTLAASAEPPITELEHQFRELPVEARRLTGPLLWLHGDESRERLEMYVEKVAEGGNGCFTAESRPHTDWLGEGWYRDLAICLDAAKQHGLQMWIFDEKWWPSGEVAGNVPEKYGSKLLEGTARDAKGPKTLTATGFDGPRFVGVVAGRATPDGIDAATLIDLSAKVRDGTLSWEVPAGDWKVMKFTWSPRKSGSRYLVDGASADAVEWYLRTVYQPHYDRFKDDFGSSIPGFFYDEPETHGDWGTEVPKILAERGVDPKLALVAWKFKLAGDEHAAARYQYQDALAEAWGRTLYGGITRWCHQHGVKSIGHFLEHRDEYLNQDLCAGNMFQLQKYSDMGAIDAVFSQFAWGRRVAYDAPCWQTPKIASSISHVYGKPDDVAMVEIFGARGQDLTYPEMKWWADHMHVSGVNFLIPHSFNPRAPYDTDCPPYFYNGGHEPRWPLYKVFADYTNRLSLMLTGGRHECPVALLFLGGSAHVGNHVVPDQISEALQDALYDCDWMPYEVLENDTSISGRELRLREESYKVLIVPPAEVIPNATLVRVKAFFESGGVVVGYGFLPTASATLGHTTEEIAQLRDAIWGSPKPGLPVCKISRAGGRSYLLPEVPTPAQLQQALGADAGVHPALEVVDGTTDGWLHVLHRVKSGRDVFFITNQNHVGEPRRFRFRVTAEGQPECWDPMRNQIAAIQHRRTGNQTEITMTMQPNESVLLVFQEIQRTLPMRVEPSGPPPIMTIPIFRDPSAPIAAADPGAVVASPLRECSWVWYPEGNPTHSAPPGTRFFRKRIELPADRMIKSATFVCTADNSFSLFVNGKDAGRSDAGPESWRHPAELDVTTALRPGANQLALSAVNATDKPSPAGVVGCLVLAFEHGEPLMIPLDASWKTADTTPPGWEIADFDDAAWSAARVIAKYGDAPWGKIAEPQITRSPAKADPLVGRCEVPASLDLQDVVVFLEMDHIAPEIAARVTVNGKDAGGFIGAPLRLEATHLLKAGWNTIGVEPFAPDAARLLVYTR